MVNSSLAQKVSETKPELIVIIGSGATLSVAVTNVELQLADDAINPSVLSVDIVPASNVYRISSVN